MENLPNLTPAINQANYEQKGMGPLSLVLICLFVLIAGYGGYQLYQTSKLSNQIEVTSKAIEDSKKVIQINDNQNVNFRLKSGFFAQKREKQIFWTNVLQKLQASIPNEDLINISSIVGNDTGVMNVSANTTPESLDPYLDTAKLVESMNNKEFFANFFIPSISTTLTQTGQSQLTYNFRVDYKRVENEAAAITPEELQNSSNTRPAAPENQSSDEVDPAVLEELRKRVSEQNPTN